MVGDTVCTAIAPESGIITFGWSGSAVQVNWLPDGWCLQQTKDAGLSLAGQCVSVPLRIAKTGRESCAAIPASAERFLMQAYLGDGK